MKYRPIACALMAAALLGCSSAPQEAPSNPHPRLQESPVVKAYGVNSTVLEGFGWLDLYEVDLDKSSHQKDAEDLVNNLLDEIEKTEIRLLTDGEIRLGQIDIEHEQANSNQRHPEMQGYQQALEAYAMELAYTRSDEVTDRYDGVPEVREAALERIDKQIVLTKLKMQYLDVQLDHERLKEWYEKRREVKLEVSRSIASARIEGLELIQSILDTEAADNYYKNDLTQLQMGILEIESELLGVTNELNDLGGELF